MTETYKQELIDAIETADALLRQYKYNKVSQYFTDSGVNCRDKYPVQMELMRAGKNHRIRGCIGGNGSGKSLWLAYESYMHLSGRYDKFWDGHKFTQPINAWLCAREAKALREGLQECLFGGIGEDDIGSGIIRKEDLLDDKGVIQTWGMTGTPNCIGSFLVRHYTNGIFDGYSKCEFKTYAQGWAEFQGPTRQWIGFDEEPDDGKILAECLARLRGKDGQPPGHFLAVFTPTEGFRDTYLSFVPNGVYPTDGIHPEDPSKYTARLGWSSSPHLSEEWKASCIANWKVLDPQNIEARTEGFAAMGSGRVYPIEEHRIVTPRQSIPSYWKKVFGLDPGQANFAALWIAQDPNSGIYYCYSEYKTKEHILYLIHAEALKTRGDWITGGIDPHEAVKPRDTGESVQSYFESQGVKLVEAKGDPNALRMRIRAMFESGTLKIMENCCPQLLNEIRTFRFDGKDPNKIQKGQDDHLCDALMYAICAFDSAAQSYSEIEEELYQSKHSQELFSDDQRNKYTGY